MKKWLSIIILILSSFMCVACGKTPTISYAKSEIQINFDETYTIEEDDITIKHSKKDCVISIINTDIAELDGLTIKPKTEGRTYIRFSIKDEDTYIDIPLTITHIIYATSAEIESQNVVVNINLEDEVYNRITLNEGCNEQPKISYDRNVISYDYITGKIVPVKVGTTNVVVLYNACNVSFCVTVIDIVYTAAIEVEDQVVYVGNTGTFEYSVYPQLSNTYSFYCNSPQLIVTEGGNYTASGVGEVTVYVNYYTGENVPAIKTFKVRIVEELETFDFVVLKEDNSDAKYYLKELDYRIVINDITNVEEDDLVISNNFNVDKIEIKENSIEILGTFVATGVQEIVIGITSNGKVVNSRNEYTINNIDDIEIVAKWSAYNQQPYSDGKYYIKLEETPSLPSYLRFSLSVNGVNISEEFKMYDITSSKEEVSANFNPTSTGEFIFLFEFLGVEIGEAIVVVE